MRHLGKARPFRAPDGKVVSGIVAGLGGHRSAVGMPNQDHRFALRGDDPPDRCGWSGCFPTSGCTPRIRSSSEAVTG
jgi:hypothetical protein